MRILSLKEIFSRKYGESTRWRAKALSKNVFLDYITERHVSFFVIDDARGTKHNVIYRSYREAPLDWDCDCKWYATQAKRTKKYCAHILAVNLRLNKDKDLREKILSALSKFI